MIKTRSVDIAVGANLPGQWDFDPESLIERTPTSFPTRASGHVTAPTKAGHMTASDFFSSNPTSHLQRRGPSTHVPRIHRAIAATS